MKKQILIDVDLTICDSGGKWLRWLKARYPQTQNLPLGGVLDYNLSNYFDVGEDNPKSYWLQPDLYKNMPVYKESYTAIKELYDLGWEIVFCSWCTPEHEASKIKFVRDSYDFIAPNDFHFVSTHSKGVLRPDVAVDDRDEFLGMFGSGTFLIRYKTVYAQNKRARFDREAKDWNEIYGILEKEGFLDKE